MSTRPLARAVLMCVVAAALVQSLPNAVARVHCASGAKECNIAYVRGGEHRHQVLDVYYTARQARRLRAAVIFVHGGGWWGGDKKEMATKLFNYPARAAALGWVASNINYRLSLNTIAGGVGDTARPYLDQPWDVRNAIVWVKRHAREYSIDPRRMALIGASAGAHLSLLSAYSHSLSSDPAHVKAVVSWAGPTDMVALANEHPCLQNLDGACSSLTNPLDPEIAEMIRRFAGGCTIDNCPSRYMDTSPVNKVTEKAPPTLLVRALFDYTVPAEQSAELQAALRARGVPVQAVGCTLVDASGTLIPCNHFTLEASVWQPTATFLRQRL